MRWKFSVCLVCDDFLYIFPLLVYLMENVRYVKCGNVFCVYNLVALWTFPKIKLSVLGVYLYVCVQECKLIYKCLQIHNYTYKFAILGGFHRYAWYNEKIQLGMLGILGSNKSFYLSIYIQQSYSHFGLYKQI